MKKLIKILLRSLCVVLLTLVMVLMFLLGGMWIIAKGPSPAAGRLFALSVRETSAVGFLANIYFSEEELAAFYNDVEIDDKTDSSLIQIPDKNTGEELPDNGGELPPGYEGPQGTPSVNDKNGGIEIVDVKGEIGRAHV